MISAARPMALRMIVRAGKGGLVEQPDLLRRTLCGHSSCGKLRVRDHRTCDRAYVFARGLPQEEKVVKDLNYYIA